MPREQLLVSPMRVLRDVFPASIVQIALLGGLVLAGKLLWLALVGPAYEMDTSTYLVQSTTYHHPPVYGWLLLGLERIRADAYFIAAMQSVLFAVAAALTCAHFGRNRHERLLLAIAFAIDPITSFFATELMSESIFIPATMVWLCLVDASVREPRRGHANTTVVLIAVVLALLYSIRLAAIIFPGFFFLVAWFGSRDRRFERAALQTIVVVALLQLLIVPIKYVYWDKYGAFSMSTFSGVNLWNNACVLYPDSSIRDDPQTEFEKFLATRGTEEFTIENALYGNTIHESYSGYSQFMSANVRALEENKALAHSLAKTSKRLILENPVGYFVRFVVPSFIKPLILSEEIPISPRVEALLKRRLGYTQPHHVHYRSETWAGWFAVALAATLAQLIVRRRRDLPAQILLGFVWFYALVLPVTTAMCLRYVLLCTPMILIGGFRTLFVRPRTDADE